MVTNISILYRKQASILVQSLMVQTESELLFLFQLLNNYSLSCVPGAMQVLGVECWTRWSQHRVLGGQSLHIRFFLLGNKPQPSACCLILLKGWEKPDFWKTSRRSVVWSPLSPNPVPDLSEWQHSGYHPWHLLLPSLTTSVSHRGHSAVPCPSDTGVSSGQLNIQVLSSELQPGGRRGVSNWVSWRVTEVGGKPEAWGIGRVEDGWFSRGNW